VDALTTTEHGNEGGQVINGVRKQVKRFLVFGMKKYIVISTSYTFQLYEIAVAD
jgi:hypothetical protein